MNNDHLFAAMEAAWAARDSNALLDLFTDDCIYEDKPLGVVNRGKDELRKFFNSVLEMTPDFHARYIKRVTNETYGAAECILGGTWSGPLEGVDATGKKFTVCGVSCIDIRNGKIAKNVDYWDYKSMMRQLGIKSPQGQVPPQRL
ncbi:MAG TPA: ester cyclase [Steroidobacteraceae bacterium]|nr:ester cyclase [Steroidobacteraceae bacterium]